MSALKEVKSYMEFWGWTDGGGPGSTKLGLRGEVLARHGDANWVRDVENACNTIQRIAAHALGQGGAEEGKNGA